MNVEVKTITKYVVEGREFDTEQEAKDHVAMNDMIGRLNHAYHNKDCYIDGDLHSGIACELPDVIKLFELAGYEIKDVRVEDGK